jgi:cytosine/adenosine deaminase-related metal-dependent hydrolase
MTVKTLIRGGCVLTMGRSNFAEADVLIDGATIAEIGTGLRSRDAEVIDATDTIVMPGFVDTHRHLWESLFRNLDGTTSSDYGMHLGPDDVYAATLIGLLGAIESGITTVVDWFDVALGEPHLEASLEAHLESGSRGVVAYASPHWADPGQWHADLRAFTARAGSEMLGFAAGARDPRPSDVDSSAAEWALARDLGLPIHTHAGVDPDAPEGVIAGLAGLLGPDVTLIQCSHLGDADFDAVAAARANVSISPSSGMSGGLGRPPIQKVIDRGIRPGLGIGSEQSAPGDMFAQMRALISVQHASYFDLKLAGKAGLPNLLNTREVLRYATVDGARVVGLGDKVGVLAPGRQADVILLRTDRPNVWPINDPIGAVVWGMDTSNVDSVFVAGRALKRQSELLFDYAHVRDLVVAAQGRVIAAAGRYVTAATGGVV